MRRRGFTLIEVMVALVVTGLVVSVAYATLQAGFDTSERLRNAQGGDEREIVARTMLSNALRHAVAGTIGGEPVFVLLDDPASDGLRFQTRGISEPLGASEVWEVSLVAGAEGALFEGHQVGNPSRSFTTRLRRAHGLSIRVQGRDFRDGWLESWTAPDRSPAAVSISLINADGRVIGAALMARVGLEGNL